MSVEITKPTKGGVKIELSYEDAEVLLRLVGLSNYGNLVEHSPDLNKVMDALLEEYGGVDEGRYGARLSGNQAFIYDRENPPF